MEELTFGSMPSNPLDLDIPCVLDDASFSEIIDLKTSVTNLELEEKSSRNNSPRGSLRRGNKETTPEDSLKKGVVSARRLPPLIATNSESYFIERGGELKDAVVQKPKLIDVDRNTPYYLFYYYNKEHSNYIGIGDNKIGPVIISIEHPTKLEDIRKTDLRCLVRNKYEDQWVFIPADSFPKNVLKDLKVALEKVQWERDCLLGSVKFEQAKNPDFPKELFAMESKLVPSAYKFGILYCKDDQTTEEEMFSNVQTSKEYDEFIEFLGDKIVLKDFAGYRGGLDVRNNTTGTHSVFTKYEGLSIMFHVATLLPYTPNDVQQVERKRHLGNDVLVIVFKDSDSKPFDPTCVRSEFNHIFVVICPDKTLPGITQYRVSVVIRDASKHVDPPLPSFPIFEKNEIFRHFILTKMINCERAAMQSPRFRQRLIQVKEQQLLSAINLAKQQSKR